MADRIQLDGKTFIPLIEAAGIAAITEKQIMALAQSGQVFLRAIGKKVYVDIEGLQSALHSQQVVPIAPASAVVVPPASAPVQLENISPYHLNSDELSTIAPIEIPSQTVRDTESLPNPLPRMLLPPKQFTGGTGRSFATSAAALAVFVFVVGGGVVAYESTPALTRFVGHVGKQVAAVVSFGNTATYEATPGSLGNSPIENSPSELQARAHASTTPVATSSDVQPIYYVYNYPVIEQVRTEVQYIKAESPQDFTAQLDALYQRIQGQIQGLHITTNTQFAQQYQVIAQTNSIDKLGSVTIDNSTFSGGTVTGSTLSNIGSLTVAGGATLGSATAAALNVYSASNFPSINATSTTATSTFSGGILATRAPSIAHTFASWSTGTADSAAFDAALVINPSSATGDANLFSAMVNGSVKFLIDAEGDVFANNLTSVGSVTLSTTTASTFTVEGNSTFGDAITDTTTINGSLAATGTTTVATTAGKFGIGTTTPWAKLALQATSGQTHPIFEIASSSSGTAYLTVSSSGNVDISSTLTAGNLTSSGNVSLGNATTTNLFSTTASSTNLFSTSATFGSLSVLGALTQTGLGTFQNGFVSQASSTVVGAFTTTGTNTFGGALNVAGAITSTATGANTFPYASSTALTVSGTGYFGTASTSNLTVSSLTSGRVPFITTAGAFTDSSALVFDSSLSKLTVTNASTTAFSVSGNAYFAGSGIWNSSGNVGIGTTNPGSLLTVAGTTTVGTLTAFYPRGQFPVGASGLSEADIVLGNPSYGPAGGARHDTSMLFWTVAGATRLSADTGGFGSGNNFYFHDYQSATSSSGAIIAATNGGKSYFSGNVGIGTSSPRSVLDVSGSGVSSFTTTSNGIVTIRDTSGANLNYGALDFTSTAGAANGINPIARIAALTDTSSGSSLVFGTSNTLAGITNTAMLIDQAGRIGIGTTTPNQALSVVGRIMTTGSSYTTNPQGPIFGQYDSTTGYAQAPAGGKFQIWDDATAPIATFADNGNVGIGTTTPSAPLTIATNDWEGAIRVSSASGASYSSYGWYKAGAKAWSAYNEDTNRTLNFANASGAISMTLLQNGSVGIGTASPNQGRVEVKGDTVCVDTNSDDNASSCIASESDERLKTNIQAISASSSLETILALNPVSFDWRATDPEVLKHYPLLGRYASSTHTIGLIAQQVMPVLPEALSLETVGDAEVQYFQLDYTKFIPHLIGAVKELWAKVQDLGQKVAALMQSDENQQAEIEALKSRVQILESQLGVAAAPALERIPPLTEQASNLSDTEVAQPTVNEASPVPSDTEAAQPSVSDAPPVESSVPNEEENGLGPTVEQAPEVQPPTTGDANE